MWKVMEIVSSVVAAVSLTLLGSIVDMEFTIERVVMVVMLIVIFVSAVKVFMFTSEEKNRDLFFK